MGAVSAMQTSRHDTPMVQTLLPPALAKNARTGHPFPDRERKKREGGPPAPSLYYYRARYYDPALGRFISEDPIGFASQDTNLYRYVWNSPTSFRDPSGTWGGGVIGGACAGVGLGWGGSSTGSAALGVFT